MLPDFVIIGAQKAASTLLVECLRQHPECYMPRAETHYFRDPFYHNQKIADLATMFDRHTDVRRRGIKCPDYLGAPETPGRLKSDLNEPDLVVILRDPVQRAISAYYWWMLWGGLPIEHVATGMPKLMDGSRGAAYPDAHRILEYGLYGQHMRRYLQYFGKEKLLVLFDQDLKADSGATLDRMFRFLKVEDGLRPPALAARQNPGVYSLRRLRWLNRRNRHVVTRDPVSGQLILQRPTRPIAFARNAAVVLADRAVLRKLDPTSRPEVPSDICARLYQYYRDDIVELEGLTGRDLSSWRRY